MRPPRSAKGPVDGTLARTRVARRLTGWVVLGVALCLTQAVGAGVAIGARGPANTSKYGSFAFSGPVSGTLVLVASTCDASTRRG